MNKRIKEYFEKNGEIFVVGESECHITCWKFTNLENAKRWLKYECDDCFDCRYATRLGAIRLCGKREVMFADHDHEWFGDVNT